MLTKTLIQIYFLITFFPLYLLDLRKELVDEMKAMVEKFNENIRAIKEEYGNETRKRKKAIADELQEAAVRRICFISYTYKGT